MALAPARSAASATLRAMTPAVSRDSAPIFIPERLSMP